MHLRRPLHRLRSLLRSDALLASALLAMPGAAQAPPQFQELPRLGLPADFGDTRSVALGDVDGDGDLDIVMGNSGSIRLYLNDGLGAFADVSAAQMPPGGGRVVLGDVDGDGDLDVVGSGLLFLNDGSGTFADVSAVRLPAGAGGGVALALGDVDGDLDLDVVISKVGQNLLYLNDGAGAFSDATASQMPVDNDDTLAVALGDVDGDGDLDLVFGNHRWGAVISGQTRLYLNDGSGTFTDATSSKMPVNNIQTQSVALGDVDGDGDLDLAIGNRGVSVGPLGGGIGGAANNLYLNDGTGTFTDVSASQLPANTLPTFGLALGDVDGDGDLDMVCANEGFFSLGVSPSSAPAPNELYLNDGAGVFTAAAATHLPADPRSSWSVAMGDLDGDEDLDLVIGNAFSNFSDDDRLLFNVQRQLHAPVEPRLGLPYHLDAYLRYGPSSSVDLAAIYLSTGPAAIPLPPFGTLGIDPTMAAPFPVLTIPQPAGVASVSTVIPNVAGLIGQSLYSQAMLVAFPDDLRLSNVVVDVIQ